MMQDDPGSLLKLLEQHLSWYPLMELRDIYKLLYQAVMGSEHLLTSPEQYTQNLYSEFDQLQPDPSQRLLEPVQPDGSLLRLNLRVYKVRQVNLDSLITALLETALLKAGTEPELRATWTAFIVLCQQGRIRNFDAISIQQFSQWLNELEYPVMHHSEVYCRAYQPAYRLIAAKFVPALGLTYAG
jgi:hypothetical protein